MSSTVSCVCSNLLRCCLVLLCLFISAGGAAAQESRGSVTGLITDPSGATVPGVSITITNQATNTPTTTTTNEEGNYTVPYLTPGQYTVSVEATGFKRLVQQNLEVRVGDRVRLDLALETGGVQETVTVSSEATPLLNAASATAGQVIDRRRVSELPLADGNPLALIRLAPGVTVFGTGFENASPGSNSGPSRFSTNGAPYPGNEFTLDGSPNTANREAGTGLRVGLQPPADAVQEFKVSTASFDAQQGHTAGASIDVSIRSGANQVFGTLYEFVRNDALLSANNFFINRSASLGLDENGRARQPTRRYNRFGGTIGGPLVLPRFGEGGPAYYSGRDRTFFFAAYEKIPFSQPDARTFTVPTAAFRNGDFSSLLARGIRIYDPLTARRDGARIVRDPFPGNIIPQNRINSVAANFLRYFPLPNQVGDPITGQNNFVSPSTILNDYYAIIGRIDHTINERNKFFVRYSFNRRPEVDENFAGVVSGIQPRGRRGDRGNNGGTLDYLLTASPTTIINLRGGFTRFTQTRTALSAEGFDPASLGFGGNTVSLFGGSQNLPRTVISGFLDIGNAADFLLADDIYSFQPSVTKIAGDHTVRFGYDFRVYRESAAPDQVTTGQFTFGNEFTRQNDLSATAAPFGQEFAAFLLGLPSSGGSFLPSTARRTNQNLYQGFFVQDDWKLTPKLTLNLGLRYELDSPNTERFNRNTRGFDTSTSSPIEASARAAYAAAYAANPALFPLAPDQFRVRGGLLFADENNRGFFESDTNNFQPRVGFAYQVNDRTVLRGGFAIYTAPFVIDAVNQFGFSQNTPVVISNDNGLTFTTDLSNPFPTGLVEPTGARLGLSTFVGQGIGSNNNPIVPLERKNAQAARYEVSLQRELPGQFVIEAAYIGNRGYDIGTINDINPVPRQYLSTSPVRDTAAITFLETNVANPFRNIEAFRGTNLFTATVVQRQQLLRPFPQFTGITAEAYDGASDYNSAQFTLEKRFSGSYTVLTSYTFSKFQERVARLNAVDENYENRLAGTDSPHRFNASAIYELPFGRGRRFFSEARGLTEALFGGFQIQGFYVYQTGTPLTLGNVYYNGNLRDLNIDISGSTIGALGTSNLTDNVFGQDLRASGFYALPDGTVVTPNDARINLTQNIRVLPSRASNLRGDNVSLLDASILKNINFTETKRLQLRAEFLNVFNTTLFSDPNVDPRNSGFGRSGEVRNLPRELQLGIKFIF